MNTHKHTNTGHWLDKEELIKLATCTGCHRKLMQTGTIFFFKVVMERHVLDLNALRQLGGLSLQLGSEALASVFSPHAEFTKIVEPAQAFALCDECACKPGVPFIFFQQATEQAQREARQSEQSPEPDAVGVVESETF